MDVSTLRTFIETEALKRHTIDHIDCTKSPIENMIYIIWSDGEVTDEKGSWAFGQRTRRSTRHSLLMEATQPFQFPYVNQTRYTGAIVSYDEAIQFHELMKLYLRKKIGVSK